MNLFDLVRAIDRIWYLETKGSSEEGLDELEQTELSRLYSMEVKVVDGGDDDGDDE